MTVHRYGLRMRPPGPGAVPKGFIPNPLLYVAQPNWGSKYRWGFLDYPEMLEELEAIAYEIEYIGEREANTPETEEYPF